MTRNCKMLLLLSLFCCLGSSLLSANTGTLNLRLLPIGEPCWIVMTTGVRPAAYMWFMFAGDPAVTYKTVSGPTWGDCGKYEWKVKWFLTTASGKDVQPTPQASESWIVQHIVAKYKVEKCDGSKVNIPDEDYYEAWRMGKNAEAISMYSYDFKGDGSKSKIDYSADDASDDDFIEPARPGTKGSSVADGNAAYQSTIKAGEFSPNSGTQGAGLPVARSIPTGFGTPTLTRHVEAHWDCCTENHSTTGTATANNKWNTYTESWVWDGTKMTHKKKVDGQEVAMLPPSAGPTAPPLGALAALVHSSPAWDGPTFDPSRLIAVANQLRAMGKDGALQALHAYRDELANAPGERVLNSTRIGLLVRMLFQTERFPRMQVGAGELPDQVAASLPLYPLALIQDVPLLADPSFRLSGKAEDPLRQIEFCEQQCSFRSAPVAPPADLSTASRQIPSISGDSRNTSMLQAQLLRLAKDACTVPDPASPDLFMNAGLPELLQKCMSIFQTGGAVWDPVANSYRKR